MHHTAINIKSKLKKQQKQLQQCKKLQKMYTEAK